MICYKINVFLKLINYLMVCGLISVVCYISNIDITISIKFILLVFSFLFLIDVFLKSLVKVVIDEKNHKIILEFKRLFFFNDRVTINSNNFFFSFKREIGARGMRNFKFIIYDENKKALIKLVPLVSGWSNSIILKIISSFRQVGGVEIE